LEALLEAYSRRPVVRRTGMRITVNAFSAHVERHLLPRYADTEAETWLREVVAHTRRTYRKWAEAFTREPQKIIALVEAVCDMLNDLPCLRGTIECMRDFAYRHECGVHDFGLNGKYAPLLLRALARKFDVPLPVSAEESSALYYKAGLFTEGVLNRVTVRGLHASRGDAPDAVCEACNALGEPHVLTLQQINSFTQARAHGNKVFIIENLPVFSAVNEQLENNNPCTVICLENGLNAAAERLIDLLAQSGAEILFSGDMDYKSLFLADKIYLRHPKHFTPWRYNKNDYERVMSDNDFYLPEHKREQGLHNDDLASLLSQMRKKGKTAQQLSLVHDLVQDINENTFK
jgi:uncharacterized protein (TIGR02679 family)